MAQVKKLETGGSVTPKIKFKIDGGDYELDEKTVRDMLEPTITEYIGKGHGRARNRDELQGIADAFLNQAKSGIYDIKSSNGKYYEGSYIGDTDANVGLNEDGTPAKKTLVGDAIAHKDKNAEQVMRDFNTLIGDRIIAKHGIDTADAKKKAEDEAAKLKLSTEKEKKGFIDRFDSYKNPYTATFGKDGENAAVTSDLYWNRMDRNGRNGKFNYGIGDMGKYFFDSKFDDEETRKAFKEKYGYDIQVLRDKYTANGYKDGKFAKPMDFERGSRFLDEIDMRSNWDPIIRRPVVEAAPLTEEQKAAAAAAEEKKALEAEAKKQGIVLDKDGKPVNGKHTDGLIYTNGRPTNEVRLLDPLDPNAYEELSENNGIIWGGKVTKYDDFAKAAQTDPNNPSIIAMSEKLREISGLHKNLMPKGNQAEANLDNVTNEYAFHDYVKRGYNMSSLHAQDVSHNYSEVAKNGSQTLAMYQVPGSDNYGNRDGRIRYRLHTPNGKFVDGKVYEIANRRYLIDEKSGKKYDLGTYDEAATSTRQKMLYKNPLNREDNSPGFFDNIYEGLLGVEAKKSGGIILKAQRGGTIHDNAQDFKFKSADIGTQVIDGQWKGLSTVDKVQLGGVALDLGGLIAGYVPLPGASFVAAGSGIAGTAANAYADWKRDGNFSGGDAVSAIGGLALDVASSIPGFGNIAKTSKVVKTLKSSAKVLSLGFAGIGAMAATASLTKLLGDQKMEIDDWKNIAMGIHGLVAGKRVLDHRFATTKGKVNSIKIGGEDVEINAAQANAIRTAPLKDQKAVALAQLKGLKNSEGVEYDLNKMDLEEAGNLSRVNRWSKGLLGTKQAEDIAPILTSRTGDRVLIDYKKANWYQKSAIRNTVAQNPYIKGAEKFTIGKNGPRANEVENASANWIGNSYKLKYDPAKPPADQTGQFTSIVPGPHSSMDSKPLLALPPSSGKRMMGVEVDERAIPMRAGERIDKTNPEAIVKTRDESAAKKQALIDRLREGRANRQKDNAKKTLEKERESIAETKRLSDDRVKSKQEAIAQQKREAVTEAKKQNSTTARAKYEADVVAKKQAKEVEASRLVELQKRKKHLKEVNAYKQEKELGKRVGGQVAYQKKAKQAEAEHTEYVRAERESQLTKLAKSKGNRMKAGKSVKRKEGGILFAQAGSILDYTTMINDMVQKSIKPADPTKAPFIYAQNTNTPYNISDILKIPKTLQMGQIPSAVTPKYSGDVYDFQDIQDIYMPKKTAQSPFLPGMEPEGYKDSPDRNPMSKRTDIDMEGKDPNQTGLNANKLSEFGRALTTRRLNGMIDTRVERPMIDTPLEVPTAVRGNMLAQNAMHQSANVLRQQAGGMGGSDLGLNTAAQLQGNSQAAQMQTQGDLLNVEAIEKSKAQAMQSAQQSSLLRTEVANKNRQTLAQADQAERAAKNEKFSRMNQPLMDFWKDENYKKLVNDRENKMVDLQMGQLDERDKVQGLRNQITQEYDLLDSEYRIAEQAGDLAKMREIQTKQSVLQNKEQSLSSAFTRAGLQRRLDRNYTTGPKYYIDAMNKAVQSNKEGGSVRLKVEETKQDATTDRELVKQHAKMLADDAVATSRESSQAYSKIQELIKMALS